MNIQLKFPRLWACLLIALLVGLAGCRLSDEPGSMSHASVQIRGHSLAEIQQVTGAVFRENGYVLAVTSPDELVFERPGSRRDAAKWGGWSGEGVTMRVKVDVSGSSNGGYLLQANAYAVQNSSDPFYKTESRNVLLNRQPYQNLLNKVKNRLK